MTIQDNPRPMGNTPVTDAAAASAPDGVPNNIENASNADLRVGERHSDRAEYAPDTGQNKRPAGIEQSEQPESVEATQEFDDEDEADDDAEAYESGVAEAQGGGQFNPAE